MAQRRSQDFRQACGAFDLEDHLNDESTATVGSTLTYFSSKLDISRETLRRWYNKNQIDAGNRAGVTTEENSGIYQLAQRKCLNCAERTNFLKLDSAFLHPNQAPRPGSDCVY